jgi:methanogenic corrinoid protein MtbC1
MSLAPLRSPEPWPEADAFETALLAGKQHEAMAIMNKCIDSGQDFIDVELHIIQPALYGIGDKWQKNKISVAVEHMATAIVHSVMTAGLLRSPPPARNDKRILLACVEGNEHSVGLRMVTDAFQLSGWDVQYLGANVPNSALIKQAMLWKPDLIGLSVSFPNQLSVAKLVITKLRNCFGDHCPAIMIGGLAVNRFNRLAGLMGADTHCSNSKTAVSYANKTVSV